jgi:holo-ACP synthase/triphosphoribosyl-dephospho-CoA synthase
MRNQRHPVEDLRRYQRQKISEYLLSEKKTKTCRYLASAALRSVLYEVSLTPKPGLVDFSGSGSHTDMNYFTFVDSTAAIAPYFQQMAGLGYCFKNELKSALPRIREIGLQMERDMFGFTKGVNTQKGIIFLMGVALFASAYVIANHGRFDLDKFTETARSIGKEVLNELEYPALIPTHGKQCAEKYGREIAGGARYEVSSGFNTVVTHGLPALKKLSDSDSDPALKHKILLNALLALMAHNNDTNILYRSGMETLREVRRLSLITIDSKTEEEKPGNLNKLICFCKEKNISPGGSADLLAVAVFLHFIGK